jgi:uncharacterized OB-fold protein
MPSERWYRRGDAGSKGRALEPPAQGGLRYARSAKCPECHGDDTEWVESAGRGTIYSHSTMRRAQAPYTLAYVTLDEGVTLLTNLVDCVPDALCIGQRVHVVFRETEDGVKIPDSTPDVSEDAA